MGALIGDALALGPHWYYDLSELRRDYGEWIDDYTDPKPRRYRDGLKADQLSQAGFILALMLKSQVSCGGYDEEDFCRRMDTELFPLLDGTPVSGPGNYTSQSIREAWRRRVEQGLAWGQTGGHADTTEAIERTLSIAVCYAKDHRKLAGAIASNTYLTQADDTVVSMTVAYGAVLGLLVQGHRLDGKLSGKLMGLVKSGALPFHSVTSENLQPPKPGDPAPGRAIRISRRSPESFVHGCGCRRSGYSHRTGMEGVHRLRHAVCHLAHAASGLLPGVPVSRRLRICRLERGQRRRPESGPGHFDRRARRSTDRVVGHPAAVHRRTRKCGGIDAVGRWRSGAGR